MFGIGKKSALRQKKRHPRVSTTQNRQVFAYRAARLGADRQFERGIKPGKDFSRSKRWLKQLPYTLSFAAICAALLYNLTLLPEAQIIISGEQTVLRPKESYQQAINNRLSSSHMNRTKVTINTSQLSEAIRQQFPEIETLNISLPLLRHKPVIEVKLATPAALLVTPSVTYVLDASGRALFDKKDALSGFITTKLPVISDYSGHQITLGIPVIASNQIIYANELRLQAAAKQFQPELMTLEAGGEELHARFTGVPYVVKFSFAADVRQSFGTFLTTKERLQRESGAAVEYIDVRIPGRAYVK